MIVYRGSSRDDFKIEKWKTSRYGFHALFFASDLELAKLYAQHRADEERKRNGGFVYEFEIPDNLHSVDYGNKISYRDVSSSFNLVTQSTNGLMSSVDKIKLDKFKFVGWVDIPAVNGTTPSVGSSYLFGGAITGAIRLINNTDTVVQITFPNMGTNNYYLKFTVESIGGSLGDIKSDNNVTHPVFRKVSQTQAVISIDKFDTVPNVRIIVEGHLF
jgi:hypothetical protein